MTLLFPVKDLFNMFGFKFHSVMDFKIFITILITTGCWHSALGCATECCVTKETDCQDYKDNGYTESGVYRVIPLGTRFGLDVYCDMTTDSGGWLVFQRRVDGNEDFYRDWKEYEFGFGNKSYDHWLGLFPLYTIMSQGFYELRIDLEDWNNETRYATYTRFTIDPDNFYSLRLKGYSGNAGDSMSRNHAMYFSTKDIDKDKAATSHCAKTNNKGGWWYNGCGDSNLNGLYYHRDGEPDKTGIIWRLWLRDGEESNYNLKKTEMKIRKL